MPPPSFLSACRTRFGYPRHHRINLVSGLRHYHARPAAGPLSFYLFSLSLALMQDMTVSGTTFLARPQ